MIRHRRGSAIVAVLWGLSITALLVSTLQVSTNRLAMLGRDTMEQVRSRWAARAGAESSIAMMAWHTKFPVPDDAYALVRDLDQVHSGEVDGGRWLIQHAGVDTAQLFAGPTDEHAKLNVNGDSRGYINVMFGQLAWGVFAAIEDWIDEDDEPSEFGVERDYYLSLDARYEPRNGPMHNVAELELVAGIDPEDIRGEDWNLNSLLDPEEDDGDEVPPWDDESGVLDGGWAAMLTVRSVGDGATESGEPRIWLMATDAQELIDRFALLELELTPEKAEALRGMGQQEDFDPMSLVTGLAASMDDSGTDQEVQQDEAIFTPQEVAVILSETSMTPPHRRDWGRININTVPGETLYAMFEGNERLVDSLLSLRAGRASGIPSLVDLWDLPEASEELLTQLLPLLTTRSNVFTITSRGFSEASGDVAEINMVVDRSTLPVRILEYRED